MSLDQPIFAYANVVYDTPAQYRKRGAGPGQDNTDTFAISSRVLSAAPAQLQAAGVKATDKPERMIDDGCARLARLVSAELGPSAAVDAPPRAS